MAKRQRLTVEQVLEDISDDEDYDDPDEPMMEGSDDEFSDLEMDEDDLYDPVNIGNPSASSTVPNSPTLNGSPTLSGSPTHSVTPGHSTPSSPSPQPSPKGTSPSSSRRYFIQHK